MYSAIHGGDIYRNEIELDFSVNVNPFGIPEKVKSAMHEAIEQCEHYPDIENTELISKISKKYRISKANILPGNGASELFVAIVHALRPERILLPVPSFYGYEKAAEAAEADIIYYKMKEEDGFCLTEDILPELTEDVDLLFLADEKHNANCQYRSHAHACQYTIMAGRHCFRSHIIHNYHVIRSVGKCQFCRSVLCDKARTNEFKFTGLFIIIVQVCVFSRLFASNWQCHDCGTPKLALIRQIQFQTGFSCR